jgi:hypothetical protein
MWIIDGSASPGLFTIALIKGAPFSNTDADDEGLTRQFQTAGGNVGGPKPAALDAILELWQGKRRL